MNPQELERYKLHRRFDRLGRLIGDEKMAHLLDSHVMVIGLGGVGSWAAESLARSGVGELSLVDFDEICVTNTNRQLHALSHLVGKQKSDVMGERMKQINPGMKVNSIPLFYNEDHSLQILERRPDFIIDAIDNITAKCHLLKTCREKNIPVVTSTGSGGRLDPTLVKVKDLALTDTDPLAKSIRKILRQKYDFPKEEGISWGIPAVYSDERPTEPLELHYDQGKGFRCVCPQGDNPYFTCDNRNLIMGNASFVTGTFGFVAASVVVKSLISKL